MESFKKPRDVCCPGRCIGDGYRFIWENRRGEVKWITLEKESEDKGDAFLDGCCQGNVYGTYVHGIFDSEDVIRRLGEKSY